MLDLQKNFDYTAHLEKKIILSAKQSEIFNTKKCDDKTQYLTFESGDSFHIAE